LWSFEPSGDPKHPLIKETASRRGALNEQRFGWGAVATDFDNDGWIDLAQANGMVDDKYDKVSEDCGDYWYVNEKVARSPPSYHRKANKWGDVRGMCIYGKEANRMYLNRGPSVHPQFVDVAEVTGMTELTNSRGMAAVDFDNTGRRDLVVTHQFDAPTFYKNRVAIEGENRKWIGLVLESQDTRCNREAIGTRVTLDVTPERGPAWTVTAESQAVSGFSAQSDKRLHFGLGDDVKKVSARVTWCGQWQETVASLETNRYNSVVFKGRITP
ncbi:MAG: ASPIC/UnbV domain-containing protein, partial [Bdellovibrionota bacterium]